MRLLNNLPDIADGICLSGNEMYCFMTDTSFQAPILSLRCLVQEVYSLVFKRNIHLAFGFYDLGLSPMNDHHSACICKQS